MKIQPTNAIICLFIGLVPLDGEKSEKSILSLRQSRHPKKQPPEAGCCFELIS